MFASQHSLLLILDQKTSLRSSYTPCFRKKTSTHIIGYKLRNSCLILIIFDIKISHNLTSHDSLTSSPN